MLHPLSDFIQHYGNGATAEDGGKVATLSMTLNARSDRPSHPESQPISYWYEGQCPTTGERLALPRTPLAEAIAQGLMEQLAQSPDLSGELAAEGKMFGVLLVETSDGQQGVLKAFSGLLGGQQELSGWVPPIPGREEVVEDETQTLEALETIKQQLMALQHQPERHQLEGLTRQFEQQWQEMGDRHRQRKHHRQHQRQRLYDDHTAGNLTHDEFTEAIAALDDESRWDGIERRNFKRHRDAMLHPLRQRVEAGDRHIRQLKAQRKELSRTLQAQLHHAYRVTNFQGVSAHLTALMPGGTMPTGTGDCCAPKLLHYAATHHLTPLTLAEFWWGAPSPQGDKQPGTFYGACAERCQPLMGFLLSGLHIPPDIKFTSTPLPLLPLPILYEDDWLIAIDKPAGLLSVPGRYRHTQDSVLSRLRAQRPNLGSLMTVHRLDQDTSGILLLAKDADTHAKLSQQFQQRTVKKIYVAMLDGVLYQNHGVIELPLSPGVGDRPRQQVDVQSGKPSTTVFQVISRAGRKTRVQLTPLTGRTHQLRVHAADPRGLGIPIVGDRLYGTGQSKRLYLHASELIITHPTFNSPLALKTQVPF